MQIIWDFTFSCRTSCQLSAKSHMRAFVGTLESAFGSQTTTVELSECPAAAQNYRKPDEVFKIMGLIHGSA